MEKAEKLEFKVGSDTLVLLENNVVHVILHGPQTLEMAEELKKICLNLAEQLGDLSYLIDLNESGKNEPGAREIWMQLSTHEKTRKAAPYGANPVARVIANFVIGRYEGKNVRFFKSQKKALEWLMKEDND